MNTKHATVRFAGLLASLCVATCAARAAQLAPNSPPADISPSALSEINALLSEKASWTPIQAKMESQLIHAAKLKRGEQFAPGAPNVELDVKILPDGRVLLDINAHVTPELLTLIQSGGGEVVNSLPQFNAIRTLVPVDHFETIAASSDVVTLRRADEAQVNTGSVDSQGDTTHRAIDARAAFGVSGAGISVGVLSDSVDYLTNSQGLGDLGTVTVLPGQSGVPDSGEGTAMLEIVHDLAPGASLFYATAFSGQAQFAYNILNLWSNGCNIIVDDVGYFNESPFQDAIIAQAVNSVTARGALYFSSAANSGNLDAGTSGTWEGDFVDAGPTVNPPISEAGRLHSFGLNTYNPCIAGGSSRRVDLFWSDPLAASANDYDLFVLDSTGATVVRSSIAVQNGFQDPYEGLGTLNVNERIVIVKYSGAARFIHLATGRGRLGTATTGSTLGHSATTNAFSVAAASALTAFPSPFTGGGANPIETFSSDGPRHVFYNANGTAMTPGDLSSTGGVIRQKPDITAADGVATTLPGGSGLNPFFGTSAAAPHAGAIAALIWSYNPGLTPAEIRNVLTSTALDVNPAGWDRDSGAGIVMAYQALQSLPANDGCGGAIPISTLSYTNIQSTTGATTGDDPSPSCIFNLGHSVWYSFTSPITGQIIVDTAGSSFDTGLAIYTGVCGALTQMACNDDELFPLILTSKITYSVTAGTTYYILAGGYNQLSGTLVFHLNLVVPAGSPTFTINATTTGWYDSTGFHNPGNANYIAGEALGGSSQYRDFFVFPMPAFGGVITSAKLLINAYTVGTPTSETYELHNVSTPIPTLMAGGSGLGAIYTDLGDGSLYGSRNFVTNDSGNTVTVNLNPAFLNAAIAANGKQIALGGVVTTLDGTPNNEYLFAFSAGLPGDVQLVLTFGSSAAVASASHGWYDATGFHDSTNPNYYVGNTNHNYFAFTLPVFSGSIINAELLVNSYTNVSSSGINRYLVREVTTPIATLIASASGATGIYNDLGDGTLYSTRDVLVTESGLTAIIPLNATFINTAMAAGSGGQIAVGGSLFNASSTQYCFGFSGSSIPADAQLRLTFGTSLLITTPNRGWYDQTGSHDPSNNNFTTGESNFGTQLFHDFFAFNVPSFSGQLVNAQLLLNSYTNFAPANFSPAGVETFQLHDVTTPISTLLAGGSGLTTIYNDLANGALYGSREVYVSESGFVTGVPLNSVFRNAITAASGGQIALGGIISSLDPTPNNEYLFGYGSSTGPATDTELFLGFVNNLPAPPVIVPPYTHFPAGQFKFSVTGPGSNYEIQVSTDLQNWDILGVLPMTNTTSVYFDATTGPGRRFYRARQLP